MTISDCICDVSSNIHNVPIRCSTCVGMPYLIDGVDLSFNTPLFAAMQPTQKIIQRQVRISSSEYLMNLGVMNVRGTTLNRPLLEFAYVNQVQSSDRNKKAVGKYSVPSSGNSTHRSITRLRPGSLNPGGTGVDVKHNSYARYLARLKGTNLVTEKSNLYPKPLQGNKNYKIGIINNTYTCVPWSCPKALGST